MAVLEGIPRRAGWVLAGTLGLTLLALAVLVDPHTGEIRLEVDPSADRLLPEDDADRRFYDRVRHLFGSDDQLVVALVAAAVRCHPPRWLATTTARTKPLSKHTSKQIQ